MKKICFFLAALLLVACQAEKQPKYIFYFIGDGMGVNQVLGTQMYNAERQGRIGVEPLSFTDFPCATFSATYSHYNAVTCSAAAGTALATGVKTKKGAIGMDSLLQTPLRSVAYQAKECGRSVGVVTTVSIDHATPAAFYAHQPNRAMGYEIACDAAASGFDFFAGSGFMEHKKSGNPDVVSVLKDSGYFIAHGLSDYEHRPDLATKIVFLQNDSLAHLPYAIDRGENDLSLSQLTTAAIDFLSKDEDGFFVMIEGGLIDWACHNNDAATVFAEVEDFSNAVAQALAFYRQHPDETLIVVTADHETGGIVLGTGEYRLNLSALQHQRCSIDELTARISALNDGAERLTWEETKAFFQTNLGFWNEVELTADDEKRLFSIYKQNETKTVKNLYSENTLLVQEAVKILNEKAKVGWTSYGHSAGAVPVYAIGCGSERFCQVRDNVDIPRLMFEMIK